MSIACSYQQTEERTRRWSQVSIVLCAVERESDTSLGVPARMNYDKARRPRTLNVGLALRLVGAEGAAVLHLAHASSLRARAAQPRLSRVTVTD